MRRMSSDESFTVVLTATLCVMNASSVSPHRPLLLMVMKIMKPAKQSDFDAVSLIACSPLTQCYF